MTPHVLIFMVWISGANSSGAFAVAEFATELRCEEAALVAKKKFGGTFSQTYHVCVPK